MRQRLLDYVLPFNFSFAPSLSFSRSHAFPLHISTTANSPGQWRLTKIYWRYTDLSGCWHLCRCPTQGVCALWHLSVPGFSQWRHYLQNKIWFILGDARAHYIALRALISITDFRPLALSEAIGDAHLEDMMPCNRSSRDRKGDVTIASVTRGHECIRVPRAYLNSLCSST